MLPGTIFDRNIWKTASITWRGHMVYKVHFTSLYKHIFNHFIIAIVLKVI